MALKKFINLIIFSGLLEAYVAIICPTFGQPYTVNGQLFITNEEGLPEPAFGARILWLKSKTGAITDSLGRFSIPYPLLLPDTLITQYVGYYPDTIPILSPSRLTKPLVLHIGKLYSTHAVDIVRKANSVRISTLDPQKTETLTTEELTKAACCNLSEAFETNATVDVAYTNAVTGVKELQMLGLTGAYTGFTAENLPVLRGLGRLGGLNFIPGSWLDALHVAKGIGPVANGYESIAGQINMAFKDPEKAAPLHLNLYANNAGRFETNLNLGHQLNKNISTVILLHASTLQRKNDQNHDGFIDMPLYTQYNAMNRWQLRHKSGLESQVGFHLVTEDRHGGQMAHNPGLESKNTGVYGVNIHTFHGELYQKTGFIIKSRSHTSIGLQTVYANNQQTAHYGLRPYTGTQHQMIVSLMGNTWLFNESHNFKAGLTYLNDRYHETFDTNSQTLQRHEIVPGAYIEHTWTPNPRTTLVTGFRLDWHNLFGQFFSPRIHFRYALQERTILRLASGRGYRTANILAENNALFISARTFQIPQSLNAEQAWSNGINLTHAFSYKNKEGRISADFYRTDFVNQIIVDVDESPRTALFYNLNGGISFSNSLQIEAQYEFITNLTVKASYKYYDVKQTYRGHLMERWLVSPHRGLVNAGYELAQWKFDATVHWYSPKRMPNTKNNPDYLQKRAFAPSYAVVNTQITYLVAAWEVYVGAENLFDFMQHDPILDPQNPFGQYFDASMAWGPTMGRIVYAGVRWTLKANHKSQCATTPMPDYDH